MLTEALSVLKEVKSEEGKAVVRALQTLGPVTPEVAEGISQASQSRTDVGSSVHPRGRHRREIASLRSQ